MKDRYFMFVFLLLVLLTGCERRQEMEIYQEETVFKETARLETETETKGSIFVDVCGAVETPGVYELPAGSRVFEAVRMAGGLLGDAREDAVNQAALLEDGQQIYIPKEGEIPSVEEGSVSDGLVNINTADIEELTTLPGIGEAKAADIIAYREEHGSFSSIEEIKEVNGIKDAVFEKIKEKIKVQ